MLKKLIGKVRQHAWEDEEFERRKEISKEKSNEDVRNKIAQYQKQRIPVMGYSGDSIQLRKESVNLKIEQQKLFRLKHEVT